MSDKKKYYYLKLKEGFFDSDDMKLLQSMKDGYLYSDILLKLYLQSLRQEGRLMYRGIVPYTPDMIAAVTNHQVGTVERAIKVFEQLGFIEILDNGAIYMLDIQNFIGQSSNEADRIRNYRKTINDEKSSISASESVTNVITNDVQMYNECTPEIRDKRLEIRDIESITVSNDTVCQTDVRRAVDEWNKLGISQIQKITANSKRVQMLKARIREYGIDRVVMAIRNVSESTFLKGGSKSGWTITFDWFVRPNNFPKVLEGNYTDKTGPNVGEPSKNTPEYTQRQCTSRSDVSKVEQFAKEVDDWVNGKE
jgi:predicted phage replisome organizer